MISLSLAGGAAGRGFVDLSQLLGSVELGLDMPANAGVAAGPAVEACLAVGPAILHAHHPKALTIDHMAAVAGDRLRVSHATLLVRVDSAGEFLAIALEQFHNFLLCRVVETGSIIRIAERPSTPKTHFF